MLNLSFRQHRIHDQGAHSSLQRLDPTHRTNSGQLHSGGRRGYCQILSRCFQLPRRFQTYDFRRSFPTNLVVFGKRKSTFKQKTFKKFKSKCHGYHTNNLYAS